mmetsp:Transcript_35166/g.80205  ORF Transcript_35166/g.80205 Transcript_35166/m.80205 type:complete len:202 (-) Transcript_35166:79-684(-)
MPWNVHSPPASLPMLILCSPGTTGMPLLSCERGPKVAPACSTGLEPFSSWGCDVLPPSFSKTFGSSSARIPMCLLCPPTPLGRRNAAAPPLSRPPSAPASLWQFPWSITLSTLCLWSMLPTRRRSALVKKTRVCSTALLRAPLTRLSTTSLRICKVRQFTSSSNCVCYRKRRDYHSTLVPTVPTNWTWKPCWGSWRERTWI